jgi:hypothetical protein
MAYSIDEIIEPFWAKHLTERSGRDPLAIQNSSIVIYSSMVVGITNVTNRIRYMGFYCWFFDALIKKVTKTNSLIEQQLYLRRAELLLAHIMVKNFPNVTGISGTSYASRNEKSEIDLVQGAKVKSKSEDKVYWQYSLGIFGQYYSGVMQNLDLIFHPQDEINIYTVSSKGKELGKAFADNIESPALEFFFESIFHGKILEASLKELSSFALHLIPNESPEQKLYREILFSEDEKQIRPTYNRRNTLLMLLYFLKANPNGIENLTSSFLKDNLEKQIQNSTIENNTYTAWYLFEINELLHVSFEHFHAAFQYSIEKYPTLVDSTLQNLQDETAKSFMEVDIDPKLFSIRDLIDKTDTQRLYDYFYSMEKFYKKDWGNCLKYAVLTLLAVHKLVKPHTKQLYDFACLPQNNYNRPGYAVELIVDIIESKNSLSLYDYVRRILLHAINIHMYSSYQKSKLGDGLVHNYMLESNEAWRLRETSPSRTTPRLQNATQYLLDIGLIRKEDKYFKIASDGLKLIKDYEQQSSS